MVGVEQCSTPTSNMVSFLRSIINKKSNFLAKGKMIIDAISQSLIRIALYLEQKIPGTVSEIWIDKEDLEGLKASLPNDQEIEQFIASTFDEIEKVTNVRRKKYLLEIVKSLNYQIRTLNQENISFNTFSEHAFGYTIERVSLPEITQIEQNIHEIEKKIGLSRQEIFQKHSLASENYELTFKQFVQQAKRLLPAWITDFTDEGFLFEVVTNKPWSAFNTHLAPFTSKLTLNSDVSFTKLDLYRLAFHEAYGGHHSELSHKDQFLLESQRGEHGLIITFSPQTFVSEAIAEGIYVLLGGLDKNDNEQMMGWYYDRLIFALQNIATFWFFDDKLTREQIQEKLGAFAISTKTVENILNFSTDPLFGKYAPVYYSAFNFIEKLYDETDKKDELIKTLFTKPCTPSLLFEEFNK